MKMMNYWKRITFSDPDDDLAETAINEDLPTTKDGLKDNQTLGVSSSSTAPDIGPQSTHFYCCI